ncbi:MAG: HEAT repeat domain-containing protein [Nitrospirae bacterium]|nr:MAG: HEAT repeat domain-containing protein [Nitrospirota bacterium]
MERALIEQQRTRLLSLKGHTDELTTLMDGFTSSSWRVRKTALEIALERFSPEDIIKPLIDLLYIEDNAGARNTAIEALVRIGKEAVPYLEEAFQTENRDVRKFIIDVLGSIGGKETLGVLLKGLKDPDQNVKASAVEYLGRLGEKTVVEELIKIIKGDDLWTAYPAIEAVSRLGDKEAIPYLVESLKRRPLTEPAIRALARFADPSTLRHIVPFLKDSRRSIQEETLKAIEAFYHSGVEEDLIARTLIEEFSDEAFSLILAHLDSKRNEVRKAAIFLLGILKEPRSVEPLLELSEEEELVERVKRSLIHISKAHPEILPGILSKVRPEQRRIIADVLSELKDRRYYPVLMKLLDDRDGHVIRNAAKGLGSIGDRESAERLFELFSHPYPDVQIAAVEALSELGKFIKEEELINKLHDSNERVRKNSAILAGRLLSSTALKELGFLLKDPSEEVRTASALAICWICQRQEHPECLRYIRIALNDESPRIRAKVVSNLEGLSSETALETALIMTSDANEHVRAAAVRVLGSFKSQKSRDRLIELLRDENGLVVTRAIESLSRFDDELAMKAIAEMVSSKDAEIRRTALLSLSGFRDAEPCISPFLHHSDWATRLAAVQSLAAIRSKEATLLLEDALEKETDPLVKEAIEGALGV